MDSRRQAIRTFVAAEQGAGSTAKVEQLLNLGLVAIRDHAPLPYRSGELWSADQNRSFGRLAHGFIFTEDWIGCGKNLSPEQRRALSVTLTDMLEVWGTSNSQMALHDETTAQRAMKLTLWYEHFHGDMDAVSQSVVKERIAADVELLITPSFYAGNNNHGMFQNLALLVVGALLPDVLDRVTVEQLALRRLGDYFTTCFTSEGVHVENSPSYHLMVTRYLRKFVRYVQQSEVDFDIEGFDDVLRRAETHAAYCLTPQGSFVPISDTSHVTLDLKSAGGAFPGVAFLGAMTLGQEGEFPDQAVYVAEKSGYAIHREDFTSRDSSYVAFTAAYNADYHKHSDEMSLYVAVDGREVLREAGPYGYDRRSPFTDHGFSSWAHNTMVVDGKGLPRTDRFSAETTLVDHGSTRDTLDVEGTTRRFRGVEWRRRLKVARRGARDDLFVTDIVEAKAHHEFTFLWHFAPDLTLDHSGDVLTARDEAGTAVAELRWMGARDARVEIISGQEEPRVQGWVFPKMGTQQPAPVAEITVAGESVRVGWRLRILRAEGSRFTGSLRAGFELVRRILRK